MGDDKPDFSKSATKKAVLNESLQNPWTLFGAASGILGGMATFLFDGGLFLGSVALGGATLSIISWCINYFARHDVLADRHLDRLHKKLEARKEAALKQIKNDLDALTAVPGVEEYSEQGSVQFTKAAEKYQNLELLLQKKFSTTEVTYRRYVGTAEQVYLSVLDNLLDVTNKLKSIRTIDVDYIQSRAAQLQSKQELEKADEAELETLKNRMKLRQKQVQKVNVLLTENEQAMTALDHTTAAISDTRTSKGRADADFESAMEELTRLAGQIQKYSQ